MGHLLRTKRNIKDTFQHLEDETYLQKIKII